MTQELACLLIGLGLLLIGVTCLRIASERDSKGLLMIGFFNAVIGILLAFFSFLAIYASLPSIKEVGR